MPKNVGLPTCSEDVQGSWTDQLQDACRAPKVKAANEPSAKERLLQAAEVSDTAVDPINFKATGDGLKRSPNSAISARKETV